ncbi:hypothetical protein VHUM_00084 [Vanrija humicola]|uniref:CNH domain-containing protein n=1 Tax=Vanrija humicola TaxID=5417 RepID=A0A7D8Z0A8_VANHU|nr:hypothetical protein VHUM_00084 [Vanrija humicola]
MTSLTDTEPYHIQPVLSDIYDSKDLLDFSTPSIANSASPQAAPPAAPSSLFGAVSSLAGGITQRAAAIASGEGTPAASSSPDRALSPAQAGASTPPKDAQRTEVRCVEGYASNLYVGGSDGAVEWWVYDGTAGTSENRGWKLRHKHKLFPARPVNKIVLLPKVSRALVLSEGTLHPLSLPSLEPIPSTVIPAIRGVVTVSLNDDELDLGDGESITDMTVVVVRRKGLSVYRLGTRMTLVKDIPLPSPPKSCALFSTFLCAALPSENGLNYGIIDLSDASMTEVLPVSQVFGMIDSGFEPNPNIVVIPGDNQFLVTSYTGQNTMGVFLNGQGDPERGTMEWPEHPVSIAVESGYIIALLRNNTVTIHSLADLEQPAQTISLDADFATFGLSYSPYGISIRDMVRTERLGTSRFTLLSGKLAPVVESVPETTSDQELSANEEPPSGSGLTPPSSPKFERQPINPPTGSSLLSAGGQSAASTSRAAPPATAIAETLLVGRQSVQGLTPTPVVLRLEHLCSQRRMEEAIALVDDERRKGRRGEFDGDKATHSAYMRLLHLYLACQLLLDTVFERAGDYLLRGKIDPRLIVRLYPAYRGKLIGTAEEVEVFDGIKPIFENMGTIEEIVADFLRRNYESNESPPPNDELQLALLDNAQAMLGDFLRKTRTSRRKGGGSRGLDSRKIDIVIDTVLAKYLADSGTTSELLALLGGPNDVSLSELEPFLAKRKYILCTILREQGQFDRVLELLKEIAEDPTPDPLCPDPVGELVQQLDMMEDAEVLRNYAVWLAKRDPKRAISLIIAKDSKVKFDEAQLVEEIRGIDTDAANRYLEHVVVDKRSTNRELHESLLNWLFDQADEMANDEGIQYHVEELDSEFRLLSEPQAYPVFFAEIAPRTPFKTLRLKLILFLQGSNFYDLELAVKRLDDTKVYLMEKAIVLGRLGRDREALHLLARELQDSPSSQTYCTQGGEVVPPKVARIIATREPELAAWAALGEMGRRRRGPVDENVQHRLVKELLGAYMSDSQGSTARTSELLSAQGVHLDTMEVLKMAPNEWPLDVITTFYKRSYRRQLHERRTWQVLKSIAAGENLRTTDVYLDKMSEVPPVLAEPPREGDEKEQFAVFASKLSEKLATANLDDEEPRYDPAAKELGPLGGKPVIPARL